ncbi:MAG TPA: T9SS type B sorting domain-containing protein [Bacteroidales bacterium]
MKSKKGLSQILVLGLIILLNVNIKGQSGASCEYIRPHQADQWIFGNYGWIDFSSDSPVAVPSSFNYSTPNGVSTIANSNGGLLIHTNGLEAWGGIYLMANGEGLYGNNFATQSSVIVPNPGNAKQYYIFTVDMYVPPIFIDGVNYSIADFSNNAGGEIISKNNFLIGSNAQKITAVQHTNGTEFWVIAHGFGPATGNTFYSYLVSDTGLMTTPVESKVGYVQQGEANNSGGYMKTSPNGKKIALVVPEDGVAELFDFDASTGKVSNPKSSTVGQFFYPFGVEFSPDNSKLYISTSPLGSATNFLYQFNVSDANPFTNPYIVHQFNVNEVGAADSLMGALQLGTDGKIYLAKFRRSVLGMRYLGVVYNPDRPLDACNYNELNNIPNNGLYLGGAESLIGLPNFVTSYLDIPHFTYYNHCQNDTTIFSITNSANIDDADWNFNDTEGDEVITTPLSPGFVFSQPGNYTVDLTEIFNGQNYSYSENVTIYPLPYIDLGQGTDTIYILPNTSIQLDAGDFDSYYWTPGGSTDQYYNVTQEGLYTVTVVDSNCCQNSDAVYVMFADLTFPSAFNPNSKIQENTVFKVLGDSRALSGYQLQIYNRWGQLIFETSDPLEGWDGTYKGQPSQMGTYVYKSTFTSFESGIQPAINKEVSGTVTLVR